MIKKYHLFIRNFFVIGIIIVAIVGGVFLGLSEFNNNPNNNSNQIKNIFNNYLAIKNSDDQSTSQYKFWHGIKNNNYNSINNVENYKPWNKTIIGEFYKADVGKIAHVISNINLYTGNKYNDKIFTFKNVLNPLSDGTENNIYFTGNIFLIYCQAEISSSRNLPIFSALIQVGKLKSNNINKNIIMLSPGIKKDINHFAPNYNFIAAQNEKDLCNYNPNNFLINQYSIVISSLREYINKIQNRNSVFFSLKLRRAIKIDPISFTKSDVSFDGASNNYIINNIKNITKSENVKFITIETSNQPKSTKDLLPQEWKTAFLNSGISIKDIKKIDTDHNNILPVDSKQNINVKTINDYFVNNGYTNISEAIKNATLVNNNFNKLSDNLFDINLTKNINNVPVYSLFKYDNSNRISGLNTIVKIKGVKNYGNYNDDFIINNFKNGNQNNYYYFNLSKQNQFIYYNKLQNNQLKIIELSGNDTDNKQNGAYLFLIITKINNYYNFYFVSQVLDNNQDPNVSKLDDNFISMKSWLSFFYY